MKKSNRKNICGISPCRFWIYIGLIAFSLVCIVSSFYVTNVDFKSQNWNSILLGISTGVLTSSIIGWIFDVVTNSVEIKKYILNRQAYLNRSPSDFVDFAISNINYLVGYLPSLASLFDGLSLYESINKLYEIVSEIRFSADLKSKLYDVIEANFCGKQFSHDFSSFPDRASNILCEKNQCFINGILYESDYIKKNKPALKAKEIFTENEIIKISNFSYYLSQLADASVYVEYLEYLKDLYSNAIEIKEIKDRLSKTGNIKNGKFYIGDYTIF